MTTPTAPNFFIVQQRLTKAVQESRTEEELKERLIWALTGCGWRTWAQIQHEGGRWQALPILNRYREDQAYSRRITAAINAEETPA